MTHLRKFETKKSKYKINFNDFLKKDIEIERVVHPPQSVQPQSLERTHQEGVHPPLRTTLTKAQPNQHDTHNAPSNYDKKDTMKDDTVNATHPPPEGHHPSPKTTQPTDASKENATNLLLPTTRTIPNQQQKEDQTVPTNNEERPLDFDFMKVFEDMEHFDPQFAFSVMGDRSGSEEGEGSGDIVQDEGNGSGDNSVQEEGNYTGVPKDSVMGDRSESIDQDEGEGSGDIVQDEGNGSGDNIVQEEGNHTGVPKEIEEHHFDLSDERRCVDDYDTEINDDDNEDDGSALDDDASYTSTD